ncbi:MAG: Transposase IS116/IS110/IS902 family protein [Candidatus Nitrotoga sp. CP45]|nr:MAG: Transposase IS116/IS110/IS902 family protein [Candidatus Nitrotoga sp. CP45]
MPVPNYGSKKDRNFNRTNQSIHARSTSVNLSGVVPVERQSGSSVLGRARMSKAGPARIRAVLYMAAVVGTRYNPTRQSCL